MLIADEFKVKFMLFVCRSYKIISKANKLNNV